MDLRNIQWSNANQLLDSIKIIWPDFHVTLELIRKPTSVIIIQFVELFINESDMLEKTICSSPNNETGAANAEEDITRELRDQISVPEYYLYARLSQIFEMSAIPFTLSIMDLMAPETKRSRAIMQYCVHMLGYLNNTLETMTENIKPIVEEAQNVLLNQKELDELKREQPQLLMELGELDVKVCSHRESKMQIEAQHKLLMEEKCKVDEANAAQEKVLDGLYMKISNRSEKITVLEKEVQTISDQVVSVDEFDKLQTNLATHEKEKESLKEREAIVTKTLRAQKEDLQTLETNLKLLQPQLLNLDKLVEIKQKYNERKESLSEKEAQLRKKEAEIWNAIEQLKNLEEILSKHDVKFAEVDEKYYCLGRERDEEREELKQILEKQEEYRNCIARIGYEQEIVLGECSKQFKIIQEASNRVHGKILMKVANLNRSLKPK